MNEEEFFNTYKRLKKVYFMRMAYQSIAENEKLQQKNQQLKKENKHLNEQLDVALKDYDELQEKYDKALELLTEYNMPCEIDEFMDKNTEYCSRNCSVDEEIFKKCWDRFITQKIGDSNE